MQAGAGARCRTCTLLARSSPANTGARLYDHTSSSLGRTPAGQAGTARKLLTHVPGTAAAQPQPRSGWRNAMQYYATQMDTQHAERRACIAKRATQSRNHITAPMSMAQQSSASSVSTSSRRRWTSTRDSASDSAGRRDAPARWYLESQEKV